MERTINLSNPNEIIFINDVGGKTYVFTSDVLVSALELYINTKAEMEEENEKANDSVRKG